MLFLSSVVILSCSLGYLLHWVCPAPPARAGARPFPRQRCQIAKIPPSTDSACPVMNELRDDARKATTAATSIPSKRLAGGSRLGLFYADHFSSITINSTARFA
jgi:hypothetical protein